jgi:hypothetical protein
MGENLMTLEQRIESGRKKMFSKAAKWAISSARAVLWLTVLIMLVGCVNRQSATIVPGTNLRGAKNFYVVTFSPDKRGINRLIADQLIFMGHRATTGPEDTAPKNADVIVTYRDKWRWDITMYMIELTVTFRDSENKFALGVGNSFHGSLTRKSPREMIKEVLTNIFNKS